MHRYDPPVSRRLWLGTAAAAASSALLLPTAAQAQVAAPRQFEAQVRRGAKLLHGSSPVLQGDDGLWRRHWLSVDEFEYDVVRNDKASLLRPALGTVGVKLVVRSGAAHAARGAAEQQAEGADLRFVRYDLWFQPEATHWTFLDGDASMSSESKMEPRQWWSVTAASASVATRLDARIVAAFSPARA